MGLASRAEVDRIVSARAWATFPALLESVERWADLAGDEGAGFLVSAYPVGFEWLSVRVTRVDEAGAEADWLEWMAPVGFREANRLAVDHFAARELHNAASKLKAREGTGLRPKILGQPESPEGPPPQPKSGAKPMAKSKDDGRGVPAPETPARAKPGPKPKRVAATTPAPAAAPTRSKPGPKPKSKPTKKAAAKRAAK